MIPGRAGERREVQVRDLADHHLFGAIWLIGDGPAITHRTERVSDLALGKGSRHMGSSGIVAEGDGDDPATG